MIFDVQPFWIIGGLCTTGFGLLVLIVRKDYPEYLRRALEYLGVANLCMGASYMARIAERWDGRFVFDVLSGTLFVACLSIEYLAVCQLKRLPPVVAWTFVPPAVTFVLCFWFAYVTRNITVQLFLVNCIVLVTLFVLSFTLMKKEEGARPLVDSMTAAVYFLMGFLTWVDVVDYLQDRHFTVEYNFNNARSFFYNTTAIVTESLVFPLYLLMVSERLNRDLVVQAMRDPLTGLYNRRAFEEIAFRELSGAARTGLDLALIVLDLDHLKQINDQYGHPAGDAAIVAASAALRESLRDEDFLCRWGGDEFCALLPRVRREHAEAVMERVQQCLREVDFKVDGQAVDLTVSSGVVTGEGGTLELSALLKRADDALYRAKQAGRNRSELAAGETQV